MSESALTMPERRRVTVPELRRMKERGERIAVITAYDATFARMLDEGGADVLLVGDSLGMVVQGQSTTLPVTLEEMIYHCRAVARGAKHALIVGDMPFMSFQVSAEDALRGAGRMLAEGGVHAVKLEGGASIAPTIARIVDVGIPVMGHVGLLPQSVHAMGGFKVQGRSQEDAERVLADARALESAGVFAIVLEGIPSDLAARITSSVAVPTIGIGAGARCDGQVLVCYDLLGLTPDLKPKFVKRYASFFDLGLTAVDRYVAEVRTGAFPAAEHEFGATRTSPPSAQAPVRVPGAVHPPGAPPVHSPGAPPPIPDAAPPPGPPGYGPRDA